MQEPAPLLRPRKTGMDHAASRRNPLNNQAQIPKNRFRNNCKNYHQHFTLFGNFRNSEKTSAKQHAKNPSCNHADQHYNMSGIHRSCNAVQNHKNQRLQPEWTFVGLRYADVLAVGRSFFGITEISKQCEMLMVIFAIITEPVLRYLSLIVEWISARCRMIHARFSRA